jgi:hypothetical protein
MGQSASNFNKKGGPSAGGQGTAKKNTQIEVLDEERPMEQYYGGAAGG